MERSIPSVGNGTSQFFGCPFHQINGGNRFFGNRAITHRWDTSFHIVVYAGPGNNGGDALAVARMLSKQNYHVEVFLFNTKGKLSEECQTNLERLKECGSVYFTEVSTQFDPPVLTALGNQIQ